MADKRRVLIVEDDPGTSHLLAQIVKRTGYIASLARTGTEGLSRLRKEGADLLLLDLMMRDMDGWTLLETIRADEQFSTLPVVIISARHPQEDPQRTEEHAGMFDDYLVKPFEVDELVAKLREILP